MHKGYIFNVVKPYFPVEIYGCFARTGCFDLPGNCSQNMEATCLAETSIKCCQSEKVTFTADSIFIFKMCINRPTNGEKPLLSSKRH